MGSDIKVGMSWAQFSNEGHGSVGTMKIISKNIMGTYCTIQEDFRARTTYFVFHKVQDAENLLEKYMAYDGKKIELYQTVRYEEDVAVINVPSFRDINILSLLEIIKEQLTPFGTIKDISAWANKDTNIFLPYGLKIFFSKNSKDIELPLFLMHDSGKIKLFYSGCKPACSFCKENGHWKSECIEMLDKIKARKVLLEKKKGPAKKNTSEENYFIFGTKNKEPKNQMIDVNTIENSAESEDIAKKPILKNNGTDSTKSKSMLIKISGKIKNDCDKRVEGNISESTTLKGSNKAESTNTKNKKSNATVHNKASKFQKIPDIKISVPRVCFDEKSSDLSSYEFSDSEDGLKKIIKKEPLYLEDEKSSSLSPRYEEYKDSAKLAREGIMTLEQFITTEQRLSKPWEPSNIPPGEDEIMEE
ncbi:hypothetical protein AYI68_g7502 [Smittium mucronatum]|uniref:CCHC-type domain-containing protein n=1 Tax=Smittium mucronatum TaxID=133383 RepID=A0A1R0GNK8_9FUNG|nr:hypothetical protein AYI68_g7502 [Smittium mucronatum]